MNKHSQHVRFKESSMLYLVQVIRRRQVQVRWLFTWLTSMIITQCSLKTTDLSSMRIFHQDEPSSRSVPPTETRWPMVSHVDPRSRWPMVHRSSCSCRVLARVRVMLIRRAMSSLSATFKVNNKQLYVDLYQQLSGVTMWTNYYATILRSSVNETGLSTMQQLLT